MIPFFTFFSATFLGKAVFKSSIQSIFMIGLFSDEVLSFVLKRLKRIAPSFQSYLESILESQKSKFDRPVGTAVEDEGSIISTLWSGFIIVMIFYFLVGFVETLANWEIESSEKSKLE